MAWISDTSGSAPLPARPTPARGDRNECVGTCFGQIAATATRKGERDGPRRGGTVGVGGCGCSATMTGGDR